MRDVLHVADLYDLIRVQIADIERHSGAVHNVGGGHAAQRLARRADRPVPRARRAHSVHRRRLRARATPTCPTTSPTTPRSRRRPAGRRHDRSTTLLDDVFAWLREHRATLEPCSRLAAPVATCAGSILIMAVVLITGASGLIGSEAAAFFSAQGLRRRRHRQRHAALLLRRRRQHRVAPRRGSSSDLRGYRHEHADIRDEGAHGPALCARYGRDIALVIHAAAQPSHDWAAREPITDFTVNANGTLNLLEVDAAPLPRGGVHLHEHQQGLRRHAEPPAARRDARRAGRSPTAHPFAVHGIDETMSIDQTMHSVFGASKVAADVMVQEYGRYFGLKTACFRGGCLTGPGHSGAELHGFLSYLVKCAVTGRPYTVFGYKGKQVRDNIHSYDLVQRVLALLRGAAQRRGLQHRRRPSVELLDARGHRASSSG